MMKMIVKTSNNETYEKDIVSINFYNGHLTVIDTDGKSQSYTKESLDSGMVTIM